MNHRMLSSLSAVVLSLAMLPSAPAFALGGTRSESLAAGTQIPVHLTAPLSSADAKTGDVFTFVAAKEIDVDGRVVIKEGAQGQGEVVSATKARGSGHSGSVQIKYDWIYAADGGKIRLSDVADSKTEEDRKGASSTATIVGIATFGIGGLFGHNLARGRDMTIDEHKTLAAFVANSVHVATTDDATNPDKGFDR